PLGRSRYQRRQPFWTFLSQFRAGSGDDPSVCDSVGISAGLGCRFPGAPGASGNHDGLGSGGDSDADGAYVDAGGTGAGLHSHGPRQGASRAHSCLPPCSPQRHDSNRDRCRTAIWRIACRCDRDRDDLLVARHRAAYGAVDFQSRLLPGARLHPGDWPYLRRGELAHGLVFRGAESKDPTRIRIRWATAVIAFRRVARHNALAAIGIFLVAVFVIFALFAPWLAPQDPASI